jgi:hypothetical protein
MSQVDQQHSIRVCRLLTAAGCWQDDLLAAALLHDIGKGQPRLWERVAFVLLSAAARGRHGSLDRLSLPGTAGLAALHHQNATAAARIGLAGPWGSLARIVGGSPANDVEEFHVLVLRAADDAC